MLKYYNTNDCMDKYLVGLDTNKYHYCSICNKYCASKSVPTHLNSLKHKAWVKKPKNHFKRRSYPDSLKTRMIIDKPIIDIELINKPIYILKSNIRK